MSCVNKLMVDKFSVVILTIVYEVQIPYNTMCCTCMSKLKMHAHVQSVMNSHTMLYEVLYTMYCTRILCALFLELLELLPAQWVGGALLYGLVGNAQAQRGGCPLIRSCMHYRYIRPSRLTFRQGGLDPLIGKHLRGWHRSFCRPFCMQSHRRCSSTEGRDAERAAARRETKQSLGLLS